MKKLLCLMIFAPLVTNAVAQTPSGASTSLPETNGTGTSGGIQWTEGLSWQEVKEKARQENKYIFLDCFTTWCGPCKKMDKAVYPNDSVGKFFNDKFISVRVQMDKTKNDNAFIQSWYKDAVDISKHYLLEGYPTFLFFSPNGVIVHKEAGFKDAGKLIMLAQTALTPGRVFNDDFAEYEQLMATYKNGEIKYDRLPFMVLIAKKLGDTISRQLIRLHENYVSNLPAKQRYTKENIEFWASLNLTSDRKIVQFFYRDSEQIDKVMNKKGYASRQVDKCIQNVIVAPFLMEQYKNPQAKSGVTRINTATGVVVANAACYDEADWKKLRQLIGKNFNSSCLKRNIVKAKAMWYEKNSNWISFARFKFKEYKLDPPDFTDWRESYYVNHTCWTVFLRIKDKRLINQSIKWMEKVIQKWTTRGDFIDTYANLLYKAGRKEDAIQWQEKAVTLNKGHKALQKALEQMKKGEPTYGVKW